MEIVMIIIGVAIIGLLVVLLMRKPKADVDTTKLEERLIRVEGQLDKINPKIAKIKTFFTGRQICAVFPYTVWHLPLRKNQ